MSNLYGYLHITPRQIDNELIPALRSWDQELDTYAMEPLLWFIYGSVVKRQPEEVDPVAANPFLVAAGIRTTTHSFRPESDIDVGLVVPNGHHERDLATYEPDSPFRTSMTGGYVLELSLFEHSWVKRHGTDIDVLRNGNPVLGIYGKIVPVEL